MPEDYFGITIDTKKVMFHDSGQRYIRWQPRVNGRPLDVVFVTKQEALMYAKGIVDQGRSSIHLWSQMIGKRITHVQKYQEDDGNQTLDILFSDETFVRIRAECIGGIWGGLYIEKKGSV